MLMRPLNPNVQQFTVRRKSINFFYWINRSSSIFSFFKADQNRRVSSEFKAIAVERVGCRLGRDFTLKLDHAKVRVHASGCDLYENGGRTSRDTKQDLHSRVSISQQTINGRQRWTRADHVSRHLLFDRQLRPSTFELGCKDLLLLLIKFAAVPTSRSARRWMDVDWTGVQVHGQSRTDSTFSVSPRLLDFCSDLLFERESSWTWSLFPIEHNLIRLLLWPQTNTNPTLGMNVSFFRARGSHRRGVCEMAIFQEPDEPDPLTLASGRTRSTLSLNDYEWDTSIAVSALIG